MSEKTHSLLTFKTVNPWNNTDISTYEYVKPIDINRRLSILHSGFKQWRTLSYQQRQEKIKPITAYFRNNKNEIARSITTEMGKPFSQALAEVQKSIEAIDYLCQCSLDDILKQKIETRFKPDYEHVVIYKPKGVILSIMPWNFPFWQSIRMIIPTLIVGNCVLLKSSEQTPTAGDYILKAFQAINLSDVFDHFVFNHDLTESILADDRVCGVSLTGSTQAGFKVSELAGRYMKKSVFELGGSDAYVVLKDADFKLSAKAIAASRLQNTGQSCIACKRVFVDETVVNEFLTELVFEFKKYKFGDLFDSQTQLGPLSHEKFVKQDQQLFDQVKLYTDTIYLKNPEDDFDQGTSYSSKHFAPVRILKVKNDVSEKFYDFINKTEFFSPTLIVMTFDDIHQCLDQANASIYGLGAAIFTRNLEAGKQLACQFESGMVAVNDFIKSDYELPFGGNKKSGHGRELGAAGFIEFCDSQLVSVCLKGMS